MDRWHDLDAIGPWGPQGSSVENLPHTVLRDQSKDGVRQKTSIKVSFCDRIPGLLVSAALECAERGLLGNRKQQPVSGNSGSFEKV